MPRRGARSSWRPSRTAVWTAVFTVLLLGGSVAALAASVPRMAYAARWQGTPGTLRVVACEDVGIRAKHRECEGLFRSDEGTFVDPDARIARPASPSTVLAVQRTRSGGYVDVGFAAFVGWAAVALIGVVLAGLVLLTLLTRVLKASLGRAWAALAAVFLLALACGLVSAVSGAVS